MTCFPSLPVSCLSIRRWRTKSNYGLNRVEGSFLDCQLSLSMKQGLEIQTAIDDCPFIGFSTDDSLQFFSKKPFNLGD